MTSIPELLNVGKMRVNFCSQMQHGYKITKSRHEFIISQLLVYNNSNPATSQTDKFDQLRGDVLDQAAELFGQVTQMFAQKPLYVMMEQCLGCDPRTDHEAPKNVAPVYQAQLDRLQLALKYKLNIILSQMQQLFEQNYDQQVEFQLGEIYAALYHLTASETKNSQFKEFKQSFDKDLEQQFVNLKKQISRLTQQLEKRAKTYIYTPDNVQVPKIDNSDLNNKIIMNLRNQFKKKENEFQKQIQIAQSESKVFSNITDEKDEKIQMLTEMLETQQIQLEQKENAINEGKIEIMDRESVIQQLKDTITNINERKTEEKHVQTVAESKFSKFPSKNNSQMQPQEDANNTLNSKLQNQEINNELETNQVTEPVNETIEKQDTRKSLFEAKEKRQKTLPKVEPKKEKVVKQVQIQMKMPGMPAKPDLSNVQKPPLKSAAKIQETKRPSGANQKIVPDKKQSADSKNSNPGEAQSTKGGQNNIEKKDLANNLISDDSDTEFEVLFTNEPKITAKNEESPLFKPMVHTQQQDDLTKQQITEPVNNTASNNLIQNVHLTNAQEDVLSLNSKMNTQTSDAQLSQKQQVKELKQSLIGYMGLQYDPNLLIEAYNKIKGQYNCQAAPQNQLLDSQNQLLLSGSTQKLQKAGDNLNNNIVGTPRNKIVLQSDSHPSEKRKQATPVDISLPKVDASLSKQQVKSPVLKQSDVLPDSTLAPLLPQEQSNTQQMKDQNQAIQQQITALPNLQISDQQKLSDCIQSALYLQKAHLEADFELKLQELNLENLKQLGLKNLQISEIGVQTNLDSVTSNAFDPLSSYLKNPANSQLNLINSSSDAFTQYNPDHLISCDFIEVNDKVHMQNKKGTRRVILEKKNDKILLQNVQINKKEWFQNKTDTEFVNAYGHTLDQKGIHSKKQSAPLQNQEYIQQIKFEQSLIIKKLQNDTAVHNYFGEVEYEILINKIKEINEKRQCNQNNYKQEHSHLLKQIQVLMQNPLAIARREVGTVQLQAIQENNFIQPQRVQTGLNISKNQAQYSKYLENRFDFEFYDQEKYMTTSQKSNRPPSMMRGPVMSHQEYIRIEDVAGKRRDLMSVSAYEGKKKEVQFKQK
ncbi:Conserved_hypothetical protein [Hexamita inflata]|uniref:Uncharacterized protein n=1 Tax=Hexamita inflata TaxID=28002 RepID=A0AA86NW49_9EUKA|nr:Conserved hypothetical protein [Hexamita inflata]